MSEASQNTSLAVEPGALREIPSTHTTTSAVMNKKLAKQMRKKQEKEQKEQKELLRKEQKEQRELERREHLKQKKDAKNKLFFKSKDSSAQDSRKQQHTERASSEKSEHSKQQALTNLLHQLYSDEKAHDREELQRPLPRTAQEEAPGPDGERTDSESESGTLRSELDEDALSDSEVDQDDSEAGDDDTDEQRSDAGAATAKGGLLSGVSLSLLGRKEKEKEKGRSGGKRSPRHAAQQGGLSATFSSSATNVSGWTFAARGPPASFRRARKSPSAGELSGSVNDSLGRSRSMNSLSSNDVSGLSLCSVGDAPSSSESLATSGFVTPRGGLTRPASTGNSFKVEVIPVFVFKILSFLKNQVDVPVEQLFELTADFKTMDLNAVIRKAEIISEDTPPRVLGCILRRYLELLPVPLIPFRLFPEMLFASDLEHRGLKASLFRSLLHECPASQQTLMKSVLQLVYTLVTRDDLEARCFSDTADEEGPTSARGVQETSATLTPSSASPASEQESSLSDSGPGSVRLSPRDGDAADEVPAEADADARADHTAIPAVDDDAPHGISHDAHNAHTSTHNARTSTHDDHTSTHDPTPASDSLARAEERPSSPASTAECSAASVSQARQLEIFSVIGEQLARAFLRPPDGMEPATTSVMLERVSGIIKLYLENFPFINSGIDCDLLLKQYGTASDMWVRAGTLDRLIAQLFNPYYVDKNYKQMLMQMHTYICPSVEFFEALVGWCHFGESLGLSESRLKGRAIDVLQAFLSLMKGELRRDADFLIAFSNQLQIEEFSKEFGTLFQNALTPRNSGDHQLPNSKSAPNLMRLDVSRPKSTEKHSTSDEALDKKAKNKKNKKEKHKKDINSLPDEKLLRRKSTRSMILRRPRISKHDLSLPLFSFEPLELARQMTLMDAALFRSIPSRELLHLRFMKSSESPNYVRMKNQFNKWSNWACAQVVLHSLTSVRVDALERLLAIASECCAVNNFNTAYAIAAGLQAVSISRLKKTWEKISKKSKLHQQELQTLFDVADNHRNYVDRLERSTPPLLPYIGLFGKHLFGLEEGNPSKLHGMWNIEKMRKIFHVLKEKRMYEVVSYPWELNADLKHYFDTIAMVDEETLYRQSTECEEKTPRKKLQTPRK